MITAGLGLHKRRLVQPIPGPLCSPVSAFIPLLLALLIAQFHRTHTVLDGHPLEAAVIMLGVWILLLEGVGRFVRARGNRVLLRRWETIAQGLGLGLFLWLCRDHGWASWAPGWTIALAPWLMLQIVWWSSLAPTINAASGQRWSRAGLVLHHLRFELAPALLALPVLDACEWIGRRLGTLAWFEGPTGLILQLLGSVLLVVGMMGVLPPLLALLWGAKRLPDTELAARLREDARLAGGGDVHLRQWSSPGGSVHNAMALGIFPRMRWILVSDDLIRDLNPDEVRAVVGHEMGHHRHRHLLAYIWFMVACMVGGGGMMSMLLGTVDAAGVPLIVQFGFNDTARAGLLFTLPGIESIPSDAVVIVTATLFALFCFRVLFGHISRACEREADLAGAEVAGSEAMASALMTVARLSGTPEDAPSWRHHPIRERVRFLRAYARDPGLAPLHRRFVRDMRLAIIAALALLATMGASLWLDPLRETRASHDPGGLITAWADKTPELQSALAAADAGDTGPLITWLVRAAPADRQRLAGLHLSMYERSGGTDAENKLLPPDDRLAWQLRHRLAALSVPPMEDNGSLGLAIDNTYAYGLVAGNARPSPRDIDSAVKVLERLEAAVAKDPDHGLLDTIACVRFANRDWDGSRRAWEDALVKLDASKLGTETYRSTARALYRTRLEAAKQNLAITAGTRTGDPRPLPLSFSPRPE